MGLLDLLLGKDNQFSQFADQNTNTLGAIGAGIAQGPTFSQGLANAAQGVGQGRQIDRQAATALQSQNATVNYLKSKYPDLGDAVAQGMPVQQAWQEAMQRDAQAAKVPSDLASTAAGRAQLADQYGLAGNDRQMYILTSKLPGANDSLKYGNTPIYARDANGNYLAVQPGSDGTTNVMKFPDGYQVDPGALNSDRAAGTAVGAAQGAAQFNLPAAKQNVETELANIQSLRPQADPEGFNQTFGGVGGTAIPQQMLGAIPGTPKADYKVKLDQVVGENFLQAYSSLKGAGAITEVEGAKAQNAMGRLSTAQSGPAFQKALDDLESVIKAGYARMAQQAGSGPYRSSGYQAPALGEPVDMGGGVTIRQVK